MCLREIDGRWDLRGLPLGPPSVGVIARQIAGAQVREISGLLEMRDSVWSDLDLSEATLPALRLFDVSISNCVFAGADLRDLRMWSTQVGASDFGRANLTDSALGAPSPNFDSFTDCSFDRARMRDVNCMAGTFVGCRFTSVTLKSLRFQSSIFRDCSFAGSSLKEVVFDGRDLPGSNLLGERNDMAGCDFSQATLDDVQFMAIDVSAMRLPSGPDLLVVPDYATALAAARDWVRSSAAASFDARPREILLKLWSGIDDELPPAGGAGLVSFADVRFGEMPQLEALARAAWDATSRRS